MQGRRLDARSWKPNLLVLSGSPSSRWYLIELADAIAQSRSFVTVASFVPEANWTTERVDTVTEAVRSYLRKRRVPAFIRTLPASDPYTGAATMIRSYGFGPIVPNTILIGETEQPSNFVRFAELIQLVSRTHRNLVIVRQDADPANADRPQSERRIDLWWSDSAAHTAFMLAMAVLLRRSEDWDEAPLTMNIIVNADTESAEALTRLTAFLGDARIEATPHVHVADGAPRFDVIRKVSADAGLVFLGMRPPTADEPAERYSAYYEELLRETESLPATALVIPGEQIDFRRIFETR
jgi:hypothetical protein